MNAILIPAYKPDVKLVELCEKLIQHDELKIVVVDDGSGPECSEIFAALPEGIKLISYPVNKGKGGALKTGIKYIYESLPACERLVTADADGQHRYEDITKVLEASRRNPGALVLGSRDFGEQNVPLRSRFGNGVTRGVFAVATGVKVYDTQTGLRAFDRDCMKAFSEVYGDRYEYEINVLLKATEDDIPIIEVKIATVYIEENKSSHFNTVKDSWRIYKCIFKFACSSFIAFLIDYVLRLVFNFMPGWAANSAARVVSSAVNFYVNHKVVFNSKENTAKAALKYFTLALAVLIVDTVINEWLLIEVLKIPVWIAKPITEIIMFFINYPIQKKYVYKKHK